MRFMTIWTLPGCTLANRLKLTTDWAAQAAANALPARVKYWAFLQVGSGVLAHMNGDVGKVTFMEVLEKAPGGPE